MAYSIFYHWFFQKVCFQRYPTSISKVIEWFPLTIFLINCCLGVSLFLWLNLKRDVIGNIFLCLCVLILSGVAVMMKMWGRRRGTCVCVLFFSTFCKTFNPNPWFYYGHMSHIYEVKGDKWSLCKWNKDALWVWILSFCTKLYEIYTKTIDKNLGVCVTVSCVYILVNSLPSSDWQKSWYLCNRFLRFIPRLWQ